jgi:ABC-2 type transport system permease protein
MRMLHLTFKDLTQMLRDWKPLIFLLAMPVAFTIMFGYMFGGFSAGGDQRLPVGFIDQDQGQFSPTIMNMLEDSGVVRVEAVQSQDQGALSKQVDARDLAAGVIIPQGYSAALLAGENPSIELILDPASDSGYTIQKMVQSISTRLTNAVQTAQLSAQTYQSLSGKAPDQAFFDKAVHDTLQAWDNPPVEVISKAGTAQASVGLGDNAFAQSSPAMMLQFAIAGLISGAEVMVLERKSRALQRLMTTSIHKASILLGHFLAICLMILVQFLILTGFADLFLKLDYWNTPLATGLMILVSTLFIASLGLLIGVISKSPEQSTLFALIPMFLLSGLGGAWMPLEVTGKTFQTIGGVTPIAWAMEGFQNILIRGLGIQSITLPVIVLLGYTVVLFGLAVWRFSREQFSQS